MISTYAELKQAVADWIKRSDLSGQVGDFVSLAESDIRHDVRVQAMESLVTGVVSGETLPHPARFIEARRLLIGDQQYLYQPPEVYQTNRSGASVQRIYTSIGQSFYILGAQSGDAYSLVYTGGFAPFVADSDTNWLLQNAPEVYLWAALKHAAVFTMDDPMAQKASGLYTAAVARLNAREQAARTGGPLQILSASVE